MSSTEKVTASGKSRFFYGWYLVIASWIMIFLMNNTAISIFFKPMLQDFGVDRATLSLTQSAALIVFAIFSPLLGRLIDRFGPRAVIFYCVGTQLFSRVLNGMAISLWHLFLARFLYEVRVLHATQVLINRWFIKKRGTALGIVASGYPLGTLILPPLSQYLILIWNWRATMLFWAAVTFVIMLPMALIIRDRPEDKGVGPDGEPLDSTGSIASSPRQAKGTATAALGIRTGSSLAEAMRTRALWLMATCHFICGNGCGFMMTHIVIFATDMGYGDMIAASLLSVQGGLNLVGVLATGHLSDKIVRSKVLSLTHFIRSLSFATIVIFILLGGGSLWLLYAAMVLFGFGWFTTAPLQAGLVADLFGSLRMGTILGVIVSCHTLGMATGAYAGGAIFELTRSYYWFFFAQGLLEFLAAVFAFFIKQKKS